MFRASALRRVVLGSHFVVLGACGSTSVDHSEASSLHERPVGATNADGSASADREHLTMPSGEWALMRFLGGPPAPGQITDTLRIKAEAASSGKAQSRHVRVERSRAGGADTSCEVDAPDDDAWRELVAALTDSDLQAALGHPDRVPLLVIDAGYFSCQRGAAHVAVSDMVGADAEKKPEVAALKRLSSAYSRLLGEVALMPACASAL